MSMHHSLAAALWLLTAVGTYALVAAWADNAQTGKLHPWVLVIVFWGAALVSVAIDRLSNYLAHGLAQGPDALKRCWAQHRLAAGAVYDLLRHSWDRHKPALSAASGLLRHSWAQHRPPVRAVSDLLKRSWGQYKPAASALSELLTRFCGLHRHAAGQ